MEIASPMHWRSVAARPCCSRETTSPRPTSIDAAKQRSDSCDNDRQRLGVWSARGRRARDAIASGRNHPVRIERRLDAGAGVAEGGHRLAHVEVVIIDRGTADEDAARADLNRHLAITGVGAGALVGVLAIERKDMQAAGKTRAAHIHHHVVETERLIGLAAQLLELV